jgi:NAD(P)-dependent dehydrogenase (short-subunit alcohol dehydrogenase family)
MPTANPPVWFITGCSSGFGHALAERVLASGHRAVVTARDKARVAELVAGADARALALDLDVTRPEQIAAAVAAAEARFGGIDILVNNAGYGYMASAEEGEDAEIRALFDANVFGVFAMTRAVLPGMRARRSGYIMTIGSTAGFIAGPAGGFYSASKHAIEGWSDALAGEVAPLGIRVTCVEPGSFRTDWAGRSLRQTRTRIADYETVVGGPQDRTANFTGKQPGDPAKAAKLMMELAELPDPPKHIVLGTSGMRFVTEKLNAVLAEIEAWREPSIATDITS